MADTTEKFRFEFPMTLQTGEKIVFDYMKLGRKNMDFILDGGVNDFTVFVFCFYIQKRVFTVADAGVSSKTLLHWKNSGLLLDNYTIEKGWAKFNFIDYLWLQVVKELRGIGVSLDVIKRVKDTLIDNGERIQGFDEYRHDAETSKPYMYGNPDEIDEVTDFLYSQNNVAKDFATLITGCTMLKENGQILIFADGEAYFKLDNEDVLFKKYINRGDETYDKTTSISADILRYKTHITISVTELILKYLILDKQKLKIPSIQVFTKQEKEILEFIRMDKVTAVTVRKKDGKANLLEATEHYKPAELSARLKELFLKEDYQDIEIKKENGSAVFKRTVKHKL